MNNDWLWDKNFSKEKAALILKDEEHPSFVKLAATLLLRNNSAKEVFSSYLDPVVFYRNWHIIKKTMRKDSWGNPRIDYWQAIFTKLNERYKDKGIVLRRSRKEFSKASLDIGSRIKNERLANNMTQHEFAKKAGISQQMLSRIEKGRENVSISTIEKIAKTFGLKIHFDLKP